MQVSTQQKNPDSSYAVAEALTFVPDVNMETFVPDGDNRYLSETWEHKRKVQENKECVTIDNLTVNIDNEKLDNLISAIRGISATLNIKM